MSNLVLEHWKSSDGKVELHYFVQEGVRSETYMVGFNPDVLSRPAREEILEIARRDLNGKYENQPPTLRNLAEQIEKTAKGHPVYSQATAIVQNCVDHLCAVARVHEANAEVAKK